MATSKKKTSEKPARKPGRNGTILPDPPNPFTSENQPSPEAKRAGWLKKKRGPELAKAILDLAFKGQKNQKLKKAAATYFGLPETEITNEMMLLFKQAEKAIQYADTQAFNAFMDRAYGKPKEKLEHSGPDDKPIEIESKDELDFSKMPLKLRLELIAHLRKNETK